MYKKRFQDWYRKMPMYQFRNKETEEMEDHIVAHKKLVEFLEENPHLERVYMSPAITSETGSTLKKAGDGWNNLMKRIKSTSDEQSTIKIR